MKKLYSLFILTVLVIDPAMGQMCVPQAAFDCESAPILCGLDEINGYSCRNPPPPNLSGPSPLCPGGGVPNNMSWWAFVAGSNTTTISINASNCTSVGGQMGVQAGIWTDCTYTIPVFCQPACWVGSQTLSGSTIPCQTYYVFIDGCAGSECDYTVEVLAGADPPGLNYPPIPSGPVSGCVGEVLYYSADVEGRCRPDYSWTVNGLPVSGNSSSFYGTFQSEGAYLVCVTAFVGRGMYICDESEPVCQIVVIKKLADEERPIEYLCYEDRHGLYFEECSTPVPDTPGVHRICCETTKPNGCVYEVCREYRIKPQSSEGYYLRVFCEEDSIMLPSGKVVTECGEYLDYYEGGGPLGCDTTIRVFISALKPELSFTLPYCNGDLICLNALTTFPCAHTTPDYNEFWINKKTGDTLARDTSMICVELAGEYCYLVKPLAMELICSTEQYCFEIPENFNAEIIVPEVACNTDTIRTEAIANVGGIDSVAWTVEGAAITQREGDSVIYWAANIGATKVEICYEGFPGDCLKLRDCRQVKLQTSRYHFDWKQVGDALCFNYPNAYGTYVKWDIDGMEYFGDSICVNFEKTKEVLVVISIENECGRKTYKRRVRFERNKSVAKLHDKGTMGITPQPYQSSIVLERSSSVNERILLEIVDITGRMLYQRQEEWSNSVTSLQIQNISLTSGLYYIVVTELTTGQRSICSVFWSR